MEIIGERINGTYKSIAQAITGRDAAFIQKLAISQVEAGAALLDVNAGTHPGQEPDDMVWLIETIQEAVKVPLCLDSANPKALSAAVEVVRQTPMINSISGEKKSLSGVLPLVADHGCRVIALAMGDKKIPQTAEERITVIKKIMTEMRRFHIPDERVSIDPLAMALSTNDNSGVVSLQTMRTVREIYPNAHLTLGLSNISYGLPERSYINRAFLTLALAAGLDSAILDPLDQGLKAALLAAEMVLARDRSCLNYSRAYRAGLFGKYSQG